MAQQVTAFAAADGTLFANMKEAERYEDCKELADWLEENLEHMVGYTSQTLAEKFLAAWKMTRRNGN